MMNLHLDKPTPVQKVHRDDFGLHKFETPKKSILHHVMGWNTELPATRDVTPSGDVPDWHPISGPSTLAIFIGEKSKNETVTKGSFFINKRLNLN